MAPISKEVDYLVIGGGSGGLASARRASSWYGAKAMAIESNRLGGTCVNVGCIPKKITWNAAALAESMHQAASYGFSFKETAPFDWKTFAHNRAEYIKKLNGIYERNLSNDKVEYVHGRASFVDPKTVSIKLDDGSKETVRAKKILIAVGGKPTLPQNIPGAELGITSDGFFELETQPKKVALVGAGYISVELAGMFHHLGTETHLFIRHDYFLRNFDPIISENTTAEYERQGIHIHKQSAIHRVEDLGLGNKRVHYKSASGENQTVDVDCLLWAIGRTADLDDLNIAAADVKTNEGGHIPVDDFQNTNVDGIYALGDVCDKGFELTPVAIAAGRKLADRLFGGQAEARLEYADIPSVVFAHPEAGSIGLTEAEARKKFGDDQIKVYKTNFTALYYAMLPQEAKGPTAYKLVCAGKEQKVVGLHILGAGSGEMLQGFGVAIKMGATKKDFDSCVAIHPTSAEELVTLK